MKHNEVKSLGERMLHVMDYIQCGFADMLPTRVEFQFDFGNEVLSFWATVRPNDTKFHWDNEHSSTWVLTHLFDKVFLYRGCMMVEESPPERGSVPAHLLVKMDMVMK